MDKSTVRIVLIAGAALAVYFLWSKFSGAVASVTAPVTNQLANWYVALTNQGAMIPSGMILLPNGVTSVPVASVNPTPVPGTNSAQFTYQGVLYYLNTPSDSNGNWAASTSLGS